MVSGLLLKFRRCFRKASVVAAVYDRRLYRVEQVRSCSEATIKPAVIDRRYNRRSGIFGHYQIMGAIVVSILCASIAQAADITVAAAADLSVAMPEIIAGFEKTTGHHVKLTLGSSGNFYAQILHGAPFEVFLSANANYPRQLERAGKTEADSVSVYANGKIVLWVPHRLKLDLQRFGLKALLDPSVAKIAIANPEHAPYGNAAVSALRHEGIYEQVTRKLVLGENISQTAQFVETGAADAGIIALSLALSEPLSKGGKYWVIPTEWYPPLVQAAVILKGASPAAHAFAEWLHTGECREILSRHGFGLP